VGAPWSKAAASIAEEKLTGDEEWQRRLFVGKVNKGGLRLFNEVMVGMSGAAHKHERAWVQRFTRPSWFKYILIVFVCAAQTRKAREAEPMIVAQRRGFL
jgi:hypothetical protein